ncbi:hypothetical protein FRX31_002542 [Thalictrum thalictroides]|uniref:Uncharacterized protein n=1 Tax=Thalictrum thalictroides TaxID=46969 RepID=A0A7J6XDP7_THATH|nr:hypothetical protein FRX31_002542 [Thalictrum thalictroides]
MKLEIKCPQPSDWILPTTVYYASCLDKESLTENKVELLRVRGKYRHCTRRFCYRWKKRLKSSSLTQTGESLIFTRGREKRCAS